VNWSRIVIAGHSEGGATATWIVKNRGVIGGLAFEAPYSMLDNSNNGIPPLFPDFTPYSLGPYTPSNVTPTNYLHNDSSNWVNKLWMTLNKYDSGYDNIPAESWPGVNMWKAGQALNKTEMPMSSCPASIGAHKWWTSQEPPSCGNGHLATVNDGCTPSWMACYWDEILTAVRQ
jgi:hypothetical protein